MFYIVEEESKLVNLENLVRLGCYVDIIPTHDLYHPKLTSTLAVYIRLLKSDHGFIIPIDHDEGLNVEKERVYELLLKSSKLYTFDKKKLLYNLNLQDAIDISLLYRMVKFERLDIARGNSTINYFFLGVLGPLKDIAQKIFKVIRRISICYNRWIIHI